MNNYLVRYVLCDWPEEIRYAKLAENEHQIIKELIYELKYTCKHERLEWWRDVEEIAITTLSSVNISNRLMRERYHKVDSLIKAGAITDPRSISKEFVLGKEYEVRLLEDDQYYVNEYHMIWVPYEVNNCRSVMRTDADYICPIQEFNMFKPGDMVSIKGQPDIVYEVCADGYANYLPELFWENCRILIDKNRRILIDRGSIIHTSPSQLIMVKEKMPHIPTP